jgi:DNA polymerase III delta prime subunit
VKEDPLIDPVKDDPMLHHQNLQWKKLYASVEEVRHPVSCHPRRDGFNVLLQYGGRSPLKSDNADMHISGPPGTGKTLTAEVLSEYFQMPLYAVCLLCIDNLAFS